MIWVVVLKLALQVISTDPADCGFGCVSRRRAFSIYLRKDSGVFHDDPQAVYEELTKHLKTKQVEIDSLWWADQSMVEKETAALVSASKQRSIHNVFTSAEAHNVEVYHKLLDERQVPLEQCLDCMQHPCHEITGRNMTYIVCHLIAVFEISHRWVLNRLHVAGSCFASRQIYVPSQNPEHRMKAASSSLPAFTATDKLIWSRHRGRHLLAQEKWAAHGFPVREDLAALLGVRALWSSIWSSFAYT